jgi:hypothetical protein
MPKRIAAIAMLLALAACSARTSGRPAAHRASPTPVPKPPSRVTPAWVDRSFQPVGALVAVRGGFATYAFDPVHKTFEVLGLRGSDGAVRWRAPATPSNITPGVGLSLAAQGNTVIYQRPDPASGHGEVAIVAVDGTTGHPLWTHGPIDDLVDNVSVCDSGRHVCLHEDLALVRLDLRNGIAVNSVFLDARRSLGNGLYDQDASHISRLTDGYHQIWSHPIAWLFPGPRVSSNIGWDFVRTRGRYVGMLGEETPRRGTTHSLPATTAAFRISDGRPLWHRPGVELFCDGEHRLPTRDLVGCEMSGGTITFRGTDWRYDHVTLALVGIDPVTGKDRWRWNAGHIRSVIQLTANQDVVDRDGQLFVLDAATGVTRATGDPVGWCDDFTDITPRALHNNYPKGQRYSAGQTRPCTATGRHPALPTSLPDFAVTRSAGIAAWSESDGVHAAITR